MSGFSTLSIHGDDQHSTADIACPLHVSTTFVFPKGYNENAAVARGWLPETERVDTGPFHLYSRNTTETRSRLEKVLVLSREGYHGSHGSLQVFNRNRNTQIRWLEEETSTSLAALGKGDLVWLESPQNPRGEVADLSYYRKHLSKEVVVAVDATFAPPPIQTLLSHGANIVMHSSTKFLGGHSDLLGGVLMTKDARVYQELLGDRAYLGSTMGNMEAWLLLRSLRTLKVRIMQQSASAAAIVSWLVSKSEPCLDIVDKVWHASLPSHPGHEAHKRQGNGGWSGVFSLEFTSLHHARLLCSNTAIFANATSLGGCESKVEWRAAVDPKISPSLVRVNVGLEDAEDLIADLRQAFLKIKQLAKDLA
ncbi:hypothetical protein HDU91_005147 [Kappamyces sp. JEL0680]|nr:hypothetical protein HDU91_005147 [Kappamyces sp. JEL0680]